MLIMKIDFLKHLILTLLKVLRVYSLEPSKMNSNRQCLISNLAAFTAVADHDPPSK